VKQRRARLLTRDARLGGAVTKLIEVVVSG